MRRRPRLRRITALPRDLLPRARPERIEARADERYERFADNQEGVDPANGTGDRSAAIYSRGDRSTAAETDRRTWRRRQNRQRIHCRRTEARRLQSEFVAARRSRGSI